MCGLAYCPLRLQAPAQTPSPGRGDSRRESPRPGRSIRAGTAWNCTRLYKRLGDSLASGAIVPFPLYLLPLVPEGVGDGVGRAVKPAARRRGRVMRAPAARSPAARVGAGRRVPKLNRRRVGTEGNGSTRRLATEKYSKGWGGSIFSSPSRGGHNSIFH